MTKDQKLQFVKFEHDKWIGFSENEHESMFFRHDQIAYVKDVGVEKLPEQVFEYNNVNSMIVGEILKNATGISAEILLEDRILKPVWN